MYDFEEEKHLSITFWSNDRSGRENFTFKLEDGMLWMTREGLRKILATAYNDGFDKGWVDGLAQGKQNVAKDY